MCSFRSWLWRDPQTAPSRSPHDLLASLLPNAQAQIFDGAGHMLPLELAAAVTERSLPLPRRSTRISQAADDCTATQPDTAEVLMRPFDATPWSALRTWRYAPRRHRQIEARRCEQPRGDGRGADERRRRDRPGARGRRGLRRADCGPLIREAAEQLLDPLDDTGPRIERAEVVGEPSEDRPAEPGGERKSARRQHRASTGWAKYTKAF